MSNLYSIDKEYFCYRDPYGAAVEAWEKNESLNVGDTVTIYEIEPYADEEPKEITMKFINEYGDSEISTLTKAE